MQGRSHLNHEKAEFAHEHQHLKTLEEVVQTIKPTAIIGELLEVMAKQRKHLKTCFWLVLHIKQFCNLHYLFQPLIDFPDQLWKQNET